MLAILAPRREVMVNDCLILRRAGGTRYQISGAHFPKAAPHRRDTFSRPSESYGHQQIHDSSAAFDLKSLNRILPRVSQGLQIGGTSRLRCVDFHLRPSNTWASNENAASTAIKRRSANADVTPNPLEEFRGRRGR
ncbi:MAG TPA: hypothetical protein VGH13_05890, partial [Xanthobacteraceae bacterium]